MYMYIKSTRVSWSQHFVPIDRVDRPTECQALRFETVKRDTVDSLLGD